MYLEFYIQYDICNMGWTTEKPRFSSWKRQEKFFCWICPKWLKGPLSHVFSFAHRSIFFKKKRPRSEPDHPASIAGKLKMSGVILSNFTNFLFLGALQRRFHYFFCVLNIKMKIFEAKIGRNIRRVINITDSILQDMPWYLPFFLKIHDKSVHYVTYEHHSTSYSLRQ